MQVHAYLPSILASRLKRRAKAHGMSVSRYLAKLVTDELGDEWPTEYFTRVVGSWHGERLERSPQGALEKRDTL